jgi:hypothetical protein
MYNKPGIITPCTSKIYACAANTPFSYELDGTEYWVVVWLYQERDNEKYLAVSQPLYPWGMDPEG